MKEYKYKINGNTYKVAVGDIDNGIAQVEVNGTPYKVELEKQSCPTLCDPMNCSTPGFPVHHQILELVQTHVH